MPRTAGMKQSHKGAVRAILLAGLAAAAVTGFVAVAKTTAGKRDSSAKSAALTFKVHKSDAEWRKILSPEAYHITRQAGTEQAFTGKYDHFKGKGIYKCIDCGNPLFKSETKFDSGTGWPSFWAPLSKASVVNVTDRSFGMDRTEILCARCGAHLGHVFEDGPKPTGLRYCMNSAAFQFVPAK